jgi:hypothetical protein
LNSANRESDTGRRDDCRDGLLFPPERGEDALGAELRKKFLRNARGQSRLKSPQSQIVKLASAQNDGGAKAKPGNRSGFEVTKEQSAVGSQVAGVATGFFRESLLVF